MSQLERAVREVKEAIHEEGKVPSYHRHIVKMHRKEWPTLWDALDKLMKELENNDKS